MVNSEYKELPLNPEWKRYSYRNIFQRSKYKETLKKDVYNCMEIINNNVNRYMDLTYGLNKAVECGKFKNVDEFNLNAEELYKEYAMLVSQYAQIEKRYEGAIDVESIIIGAKRMLSTLSELQGLGLNGRDSGSKKPDNVIEKIRESIHLYMK